MGGQVSNGGFRFQSYQGQHLDLGTAGMGWATVATDGLGGWVCWNPIQGDQESTNRTNCDRRACENQCAYDDPLEHVGLVCFLGLNTTPPQRGGLRNLRPMPSW